MTVTETNAEKTLKVGCRETVRGWETVQVNASAKDELPNCTK